MDADRRRKTVIAGTFAIACKSLSNAQPISADRSQRTKAEMTMASMYVPTLHEARAEGIYARVSNHDLRMDRTVFASAQVRVLPHHDRTDGRRVGGGRSWESRQRDPAGKISVVETALALAPRDLPFFLFQTPANIFERSAKCPSNPARI
jgi:hypothetical protein